VPQEEEEGVFGDDWRALLDMCYVKPFKILVELETISKLRAFICITTQHFTSHNFRCVSLL
jgi:hypothetical protein